MLSPLVGFALALLLTLARSLIVPEAAVVPIIVSVEVPVGVLPFVVVTVIVEVPLVVTVAGEKLAVAPAGKPLELSVTVPVNPFSAPMVTV